MGTAISCSIPGCRPLDKDGFNPEKMTEEERRKALHRLNLSMTHDTPLGDSESSRSLEPKRSRTPERSQRSEGHPTMLGKETQGATTSNGETAAEPGMLNHVSDSPKSPSDKDIVQPGLIHVPDPMEYDEEQSFSQESNEAIAAPPKKKRRSQLFGRPIPTETFDNAIESLNVPGAPGYNTTVETETKEGIVETGKVLEKVAPVVHEAAKEEDPVGSESVKEEVPAVHEAAKRRPEDAPGTPVVSEGSREVAPVVHEAAKEEDPVDSESVKEEVPAVHEAVKEENPVVIEAAKTEDPVTIDTSEENNAALSQAANESIKVKAEEVSSQPKDCENMESIEASSEGMAKKEELSKPSMKVSSENSDTSPVEGPAKIERKITRRYRRNVSSKHKHNTHPWPDKDHPLFGCTDEEAEERKKITECPAAFGASWWSSPKAINMAEYLKGTPANWFKRKIMLAVGGGYMELYQRDCQGGFSFGTRKPLTTPENFVKLGYVVDSLSINQGIRKYRAFIMKEDGLEKVVIESIPDGSTKKDEGFERGVRWVREDGRMQFDVYNIDGVKYTRVFERIPGREMPPEPKPKK